jgi:3'-phosphoadenosine 5'-phosphosulfate sulfotransferase (PAPS reductase)/FAD synthetase
MRCPRCGGLIVYDGEKVELVCALCGTVVTESIWPYPPELMEAVYTVLLTEKVERAKELIRRHVRDKAVVALSGKDSLAALHLALTSGVNNIAAVISRYIAERRVPTKIVDELRGIAESMGANVIIHDEPWDVHSSLFTIISHKYGVATIVTGLRRGENRGHRHAIETIAGIKIVNPIITWRTLEVWSYLYHHKIPIPTPYRMAPPNASLQHLIF